MRNAFSAHNASVSCGGCRAPPEPALYLGEPLKNSPDLLAVTWDWEGWK